MDARTLYNVETGRTGGLRSEMLDKVAKALGTTADALKAETVADETPVMLPAELVAWCETQANGEPVAAWIAGQLIRLRNKRQKPQDATAAPGPTREGSDFDVELKRRSRQAAKAAGKRERQPNGPAR